QAGRPAAGRDQPQKRAVLPSVAAAEQYVSLWVSQARARQQRHRDPPVRSLGCRARKDHRAAQTANCSCLRTVDDCDGGGALIRKCRLGARIIPLATAVVILATGSTVSAQREPFPIPDPDPEIERKSFVVADGFEVNLFASDPLIAKPLQ